MHGLSEGNALEGANKGEGVLRQKEHIQFNVMYVCTLKGAKDRHGLQKQPEDAGIADFGFLGSQNSKSMERGGRAGERVEVEDGGSTSLSEKDN